MLLNPSRSDILLRPCLGKFWLPRQSFAAYLSKTLHFQCGGSAPSSVVFSLPLPELGLFRGGGPHLSQRRWLCPLRKRLLHLVVVALNYFYDGFREKDIWQLGRRPSIVQKKVHRRLWSLITTCDAPGTFPISPGRSWWWMHCRAALAGGLCEVLPSAECGCVSGGTCWFVQEGWTAKRWKTRKLNMSQKTESSRSIPRLMFQGWSWLVVVRLNIHDELWLPYVEPGVLRRGIHRPDVVGTIFTCRFAWVSLPFG